MTTVELKKAAMKKFSIDLPVVIKTAWEVTSSSSSNIIRITEKKAVMLRNGKCTLISQATGTIIPSYEVDNYHSDLTLKVWMDLHFNKAINRHVNEWNQDKYLFEFANGTTLLVSNAKELYQLLDATL